MNKNSSFHNPSKEHSSKISQFAKNRVNRGIFLKPGTYHKYIEYLRTKPMQGTMETHHILPKHKQGTDTPSNLIKISIRDHILAHLLLYLEKGDKYDLIAYTLRQSSQHVDLKSQGQLLNFLNKITNKGWYNSDVQSRLGKKGGKKGGARNTQKQKDARSKIGQCYGVLTGISNQSELLKTNLQKISIFSHRKLPELQILVPSQPSVIAVAHYINEQCDVLDISHLKIDLTKVRKGGPFYGLLKKTKSSAYGWIRVDEYPFAKLDD